MIEMTSVISFKIILLHKERKIIFSDFKSRSPHLHISGAAVLTGKLFDPLIYTRLLLCASYFHCI